MKAAPVRQLVERARTGQRHVPGHVKFDAGRQRQAAPDGATRCVMKLMNRAGPECRRPRGTSQGNAYFIEATPCRLKSLDLEKTLEVRLAVVRPASDPEGWRNEPFLHVVTHGAAGHVRDRGQVLYRIPGFDSHQLSI